MTSLLAGLCAAVGVALLFPVRGSMPTSGPARPAAAIPETSVLVRYRLVVSVLAGAGAISFLGPPLGWVVAAVAAVAVWVTIGRLEPVGVRREREQVRRDLPHVVQMLGVALASGSSLSEAIRQVALALPGPATVTLRGAEGRLSVGVPAGEVWAALSRQPGFERVGRAFGRAESSGAPIADVMLHLGEELARSARAEVEDRARTVGVRAALPLGLCLLPAFLVVGIVPVVASSLSSLPW
ncbi:MAG: type II secretion system F family protein [Nocardioides sp.]|nr:type II secretion system F family protein [Nocardioides sp.]